jgi:predicted metal-dependent hydrolase
VSVALDIGDAVRQQRLTKELAMMYVFDMLVSFIDVRLVFDGT